MSCNHAGILIPPVQSGVNADILTTDVRQSHRPSSQRRRLRVHGDTDLLAKRGHRSFRGQNYAGSDSDTPSPGALLLTPESHRSRFRWARIRAAVPSQNTTKE